MKPYLLLLMIIIVGGGIIFVPQIIKNQKGSQQADFSKKIEANTNEENILVLESDLLKEEQDEIIEEEKIQIIESSLETIQNVDNVELEGEPYDPEQIYVENLEYLYDYFSFFEVDYIKEQITTYLKNVSINNILDCSIDISSIEGNKGNKLSFTLLYGEKKIEVLTEKDENTVRVIFVETEEENENEQ